MVDLAAHGYTFDPVLEVWCREVSNQPIPRPEEPPKASLLSEEQIEQVKTLRKAGVLQQQLATQFKVPQCTISKVCTGIKPDKQPDLKIPRKLTTEEIAEVWRLRFEEHLSYRVIGEKMSMRGNSVMRVCWKHPKYGQKLWT